MFFGSSHSVQRRSIHVDGTEYESAWGEELESSNCLVQTLMILLKISQAYFADELSPIFTLYSASPNKQTGRYLVIFCYGGRE